MLGFNIVVSLFVSSVLFSATALATTEQSAIQLKLVDEPVNLEQILKLKDQMVLSETPAKLSKNPSATCFQANIDEYLLNQAEDHKKIYGCIFSDQVTMNSALLRAGLFVHTGVGGASDEQLFNSNLMTAVGGHDFNGIELVKYNQSVKIPTEDAPEHKKLKAIERQFKKDFLNKIIAQNQSNFIFFGVMNSKKIQANLTHELLHAQYYSVPEISPILLDVWKTKVTAQDQKTIIDCLINGGYDMRQQELLLREFYSYFMQYDATEYLKSIKVLAPMSPLAEIYAPQISEALKQKGIRVIQLPVNLTQN